MTTSPTRTRRWTRAEYDRLIEVGVFHSGEPVELLGGELIVCEPQGSLHYTAILLVEDALRASRSRSQTLRWFEEARGTIAASIPRGPY